MNAFIKALTSGRTTWKPGKTVTFELDGDWSPGAKRAVADAMDAWEAVANVRFEPAGNKAPNLVLGLEDLEGPTLGQTTVSRDDGYSSIAIVTFDRPEFEKAKGHLVGGGDLFITVLHEVGHVLGLKHPWPDEKGRGAPRSDAHFPGVSDDNDYGPHDTNIELFTVMSYHQLLYIQNPLTPRQTIHNSMAPERPQSSGFAVGPMAFDIAAIQSLYGANLKTGAGANTYDLNKPSGLDARAAFHCIWDSGGEDKIVYAGKTDCVIDLRAATLKPGDPHAGGFLSYFEGGGPIDPDIGPYGRGIFKGLTIANGVEIEKAFGGSGHDVITGNRLDNFLSGGAGDDTISSGKGVDIVVGGPGDDTIRIAGVKLGSVREKVNQGEDTVYFADPSFEGTQNVERFYYTGTSHYDLNISRPGFYRVGNQGSDVSFQAASKISEKIQVAAGHGKDVFHFRTLKQIDFAERISGFKSGIDKVDGSDIPVQRKFQTSAQADAFLDKTFLTKPASLQVAIRREGGIEYSKAVGFVRSVDEDGDPLWGYELMSGVSLQVPLAGSIGDYIL